MGKQLFITASDGHQLEAYLSLPNGQSRGGVVVIQDAYGLSEYIRSVCDAYAADGYFSIAPAIYDRQAPGSVFPHHGEAQSKARQFRANLVWEDVLKDIEAAMGQLQGRIGIIGFCVGGSAAWLAGARLSVAAVSAYYGKDVVDFLDTPPKCPALLHFGDRDHLIGPEDIHAIRSRYPKMPIFTYAAGHGFDGPGAGHDATSAALARERTLDMLSRYIG